MCREISSPLTNSHSALRHGVGFVTFLSIFTFAHVTFLSIFTFAHVTFLSIFTFAPTGSLAYIELFMFDGDPGASGERSGKENEMSIKCFASKPEVVVESDLVIQLEYFSDFIFNHYVLVHPPKGPFRKGNQLEFSFVADYGFRDMRMTISRQMCTHLARLFNNCEKTPIMVLNFR